MKIRFICPYFGKLPNYFQLWLNSCSYNEHIEWLVITDDMDNYKYPKNVNTLYCTFDEFKGYVQRKFDFPISLDAPYKLCDYKPAYGYIFSELLEGYDYWGYCDFDLIFGDIKKFITKNILLEHEKILLLGHMAIYKNTKEVNNRFKLSVNSNINYRDIFSSKRSYAFDEITSYSINSIYYKYGFPIYKGYVNLYADISPLYYNFRLVNLDEDDKFILDGNLKQLFYWEKGNLFSYFIEDGLIKKSEYLYIHLQKRKMNCQIKNMDECNQYVIVPNKFIEFNEEINKELINRYSRRKLIYKKFFELKLIGLKQRIKRMIEKGN